MIQPTELLRRAWMSEWRSSAVEMAGLRQEELVEVEPRPGWHPVSKTRVLSIRAEVLPFTSGLTEQRRLLHRRPELAGLAVLLYRSP